MLLRTAAAAAKLAASPKDYTRTEGAEGVPTANRWHRRECDEINREQTVIYLSTVMSAELNLSVI